MTDKVQKIREEVVRIHKLLPVMDGDNIYVNYADRICTTLEMYIDSLQEEPVSEDLDEAAWLYYDKNRLPIPPEWDLHKEFIDFFKAGAQWQKQQMMKDALEAEVTYGKSISIPSLGYFLDKNCLDFGNKVRVIIIKDE